MSHEEFEPIESLLRSLPLRRPSPALDERIDAARPHSRLSGRRLRLASVVAAAAALAAGLLVVLFCRPGGNGRDEITGPADRPAIAGTTPQQSGSGDHATAAQQNSRPAPIRIEQVGATAPAEEVVLRDDNPPMRRLRQQVVRHVRWIDRQRHIQIEWNIPSEQTILVPLEYN